MSDTATTFIAVFLVLLPLCLLFWFVRRVEQIVITLKKLLSSSEACREHLEHISKSLTPKTPPVKPIPGHPSKYQDGPQPVHREEVARMVGEKR